MMKNVLIFSRLLVMNDRRRAGKPYTIDTIVTTVTNEHGWSEDIYFKLATIGKAVCLNSRLNSKR